MENKNAKKIVFTVVFMLLVICMVFVVVKVIDIYKAKHVAINNEQSNESSNNNVQNNQNGEQQDDITDNSCEPFICYDDVSNVEKQELIAKADEIDGRLRKVLVLLSLYNDKEGKYTLNDVDKLILHSLVINNFIEEEKQLLLENEIDNATVSASDYEKVFTDITGIKDVKAFYKGYDLKAKKDSNKSVYYEENGKTYYIVPFGIGMETGLSVMSDVTEKDGRTQLTIKTYEVDYENDKYTHIKTTTFEIETNGLRVYSFNAQKVK